MTSKPIPQQSEGMRCPRNLIIPLAVVICASIASMLVVNVPAVAPISALVLAAVLIFAFLSQTKKA